MILVKLLKNVPPGNAGEGMAFPDERAADLIREGRALYIQKVDEATAVTFDEKEPTPSAEKDVHAVAVEAQKHAADLVEDAESKAKADAEAAEKVHQERIKANVAAATKAKSEPVSVDTLTDADVEDEDQPRRGPGRPRKVPI